jgi:hypothetical protein
MLQRVPKLVNEAVGENLLCLGVVGKSSNDSDGPLHEIGLVVLQRLSLDLFHDDVFQGLDVLISDDSELRA